MGAFFEDTWDLICKGAVMAAGFLSGLYTGNNGAMILLVIVMAADYISGIALALLHKSDKTRSGGLSSAAGMKGLVKKGLIALVVLVCALLDRFSGQGNAMFQSAATWFYISNEAISLLENLAMAGVPVPKKLRSLLEKLKEDDEKPPENSDVQNG